MGSDSGVAPTRRALQLYPRFRTESLQCRKRVFVPKPNYEMLGRSALAGYSRQHLARMVLAIVEDDNIGQFAGYRR